MQTYCPSCQFPVGRLSGDTCPHCKWPLGGAASGRSIVKPAARPKVQSEIDLATTVDRTGSSERFKAGIPATYELIVRSLIPRARTLRCTVQSHGDLDDGQNMILHTEGGTPVQAIADVRQIAFEGGGDPPEHHLDAILNLLQTVPWTADPRRARGAILGFLTADTKPARAGVGPRELGVRIKSRGVLLYLVCEPTPALVELVEGAEGLLFEITNNPDPQELHKIAAQLAASIVATVSAGGTVPLR